MNRGVEGGDVARMLLYEAVPVAAGEATDLGLVTLRERFVVINGGDAGTSSPDVTLEEDLLRREDLLDAFAVIVGETDVAHHKPDPEGLLTAMAALGVQRDAPVLGQAPLGDVQIRHDLDAADDRRGGAGRRRFHL